MHRAFVLLQVAETLALLPAARVRDLARQLGPRGDDLLQADAQLKPADARKVRDAADRATLECADCGAETPARQARNGSDYFCGECRSANVNVAGAQPMPAPGGGPSARQASPATIDDAHDPGPAAPAPRATTGPSLSPLPGPAQQAHRLDSSSSSLAIADGAASLTRRLTRSGPAIVAPADRHWQTRPFRQAGPFTLRHVVGSYDLMHARAVSALALPPGGDLIASGGFDHTVKLWDASSGREICNLGTHRRRVTALVVSPDGETLISGGLDGRLVFWHTSSTRPLAKLEVKVPLHGLSMSANGRLLALGVETGPAKILSARSARPRRELAFPGMKGPLAVALDHDGERLAAAGTGGSRVAIRDLDNGRELQTLEAPEPVAHLLWLDDDGSGGGALLVAGATSAQIHRAVPPTGDGGKLVAAAGMALPLRGHRIVGVSRATDGRRAVFGLADGGVMVFNVAGSATCSIPHAHAVRVQAVALDGDRLVTGGADHTVRVWSAGSGRESIEPTGHRGQVARVAVSLPDFLTGGARILSVGEDATARVTDLSEGSEVLCYDGHLVPAGQKPPQVGGAALSRDGSMAATASTAGDVHIWAVDRDSSSVPRESGGTQPCIVRHPEGRAFTAAAWLVPLTAPLPGHVRQQTGRRHAASLAGGVLALGDSAGAVMLLDTATQRFVARTPAHTRGVLLLCAQDDGRRVLSLGADGTARLFGIGSVSEPLRPVADFAQREKLQVATLSPDGTLVVVGGRDRADVLAVEGGAQVVSLNAEGAGWITAVAITPDNRFVFTAGEHGSLSVWGREPKLKLWANLGTLSLEAATDYISCMTLDRDGRLLVAGTARGVLLVFDLADDFFGGAERKRR